MTDYTLGEFLEDALEFVERMDPARPENIMRRDCFEEPDGKLYFTRPVPYVSFCPPVTEPVKWKDA